MPTIGSELLGPLGVTVVVLLAFWATFVREPPLAYSRQRYVEMEQRAERAEMDRDYYYREALEARGASEQIINLVRRREAHPEPEPTPPPGAWGPRLDSNRGTP